MKRYQVYHRSWYKNTKNWPADVDPAPGTHHHIAYAFTADEAQQITTHWNGLRETGPLADRAEWKEVTY